MANTKISALTANTNPTGNEELVYAYNNANGKMTLNTMKTFASADSQATLVSGVNIKTINWTSILGSGNIDVSWGGGWGGFEPTELWGDANIWELSEWAYVTTYDLYYKTWEALPAYLWGDAVKKRMLFVVVDSANNRWYFAYSADSRASISGYGKYACFWYSKSSSDWDVIRLWAWDAAITWICNTYTWWLDALYDNVITHVISNFVNDTSSLRVSSSDYDKLYPWLTYTIYVASYASWETATIALGNGVTNPLNIALPTNSNKPFIITLLATSTTTAIVTGCTIQN